MSHNTSRLGTVVYTYLLALRCIPWFFSKSNRETFFRRPKKKPPPLDSAQRRGPGVGACCFLPTQLVAFSFTKKKILVSARPAGFARPWVGEWFGIPCFFSKSSRGVAWDRL